jgi:hypothetical protein
MSDELRYVNDRKKLESQLGNSLDKPSLIMQRQVNGKTKSDAEQLQPGYGYGGYGRDRYGYRIHVEEDEEQHIYINLNIDQS